MAKKELTKIARKVQPLISDEKSVLIISDDQSMLEFYGGIFSKKFNVDTAKRHKVQDIIEGAKQKHNNIAFVHARSKRSRFDCAQILSKARPFITCVFLGGTDVEESDDIWYQLDECNVVTDCSLDWNKNKFLIGGDRVQASTISILYKTLYDNDCDTMITRRLHAELALNIKKEKIKFDDVYPSIQMDVQRCISFLDC